MRRFSLLLTTLFLLASCKDPGDPADPGTGGGACGAIGDAAAEGCVYGIGFSADPIRGISCTDVTFKIDGQPMSLTFDRSRKGKSPAVFDDDGSLTQASDTLDGCYVPFGSAGFAQLNFRDAAGTQRLTLDIGSYGDAGTNDAHTHDSRDGCMVHAYAWSDKGVYLGRFETPAVDGEYPETDGIALGMQSGTYTCTAGDANPVRVELHAVHIVNDDYRTVGQHSIDLDGTIEVQRK